MQPKRRRSPPKDPRRKFTPAERAKAKPPPVEREAFEEVIQRLLSSRPVVTETASKAVGSRSRKGGPRERHG